MEEKNWLEPTRIIEYNKELGEKCIVENDWSMKSINEKDGE